MAFREKGDILLATTVVEVGFPLPRLSSVVIVGAVGSLDTPSVARSGEPYRIAGVLLSLHQ